MALLEATGDYFDKLDGLIAEQVKPLKRLAAMLSSEYTRMVGVTAAASGTPLDDLVLDRFGHDVDLAAMQEWLNGRPFVGNRIRERVDALVAFRIPSILLIYYSASTAPSGTPTNCPISEKELELVYSDLGQSIEG